MPLVDRIAGLMPSFRYGLILDALGGAGIVSLGNTGNYFYKTLKAKRSIPPMLTEAFCVAALSYMLVHAVRFATVNLIRHSAYVESFLAHLVEWTYGCMR